VEQNEGLQEQVVDVAVASKSYVLVLEDIIVLLLTFSVSQPCECQHQDKEYISDEHALHELRLVVAISELFKFKLEHCLIPVNPKQKQGGDGEPYVLLVVVHLIFLPFFL
jgi:hypothetical protein